MVAPLTLAIAQDFIDVLNMTEKIDFFNPSVVYKDSTKDIKLDISKQIKILRDVYKASFGNQTLQEAAKLLTKEQKIQLKKILENVNT